MEPSPRSPAPPSTPRGHPAGQVKPSKILLGKDTKGNAIELPIPLLKRHLVVLGSSGSGKTVLSKCVLEEAALNGIPAVIIDPQGDLASLALAGDPDEMLAHGTDPARLKEYMDKVEVRTFTPASSKGIPLSANPLQLPPPDLPEEEKIRSLDLVCSSLTLLLGYDTEAEEGKAVKGLLYAVFEDALKRGSPFRDFDGLASFVLELPDGLLQKTAAFASEKDRAKLARNLRFMNVGMNQLLFTFGVPVSAELFMRPSVEGKVPVNIIYLNTLASDEHKQFFVTMVAREIYNWMLRNPSEEPQLVLYVDEVGPYLPPNPYSPPAKDLLRLLFKQGRKYGVSCLMSTQNVADVDYKAMAQAGTWALGRMMTVQDLEKVKHILRAMNTANLEEILAALPQLKAGEFVLICPDIYPAAVRMKVRWLLSKHVTLEEEKLRETMSAELLAYFDGLRMAPPPARPSSGPELIPGTQPIGSATARSPPDAAGAPRATPPLTEEAAGGLGIAWELKKAPSVLASYQGTMLICRLNFPQVLASNIARKLTASGMFEKVAVDKGELRYLPLWQLTLTVSPSSYMNSFVKMFARGADKPVREKVYVNGINGKLLVIKDKFRFENVASEDPTRIRDLDGEAQYEERPLDPDMPDMVTARIDHRLAIALGFKMFGVTAEEAKLVLLPVWAFTTRVEGKWVAIVKYIDGVLGLEIPQDPFSGY